MIKKSILFGLLLLVLYAGALEVLQPKWKDTATQYRQNLERCESWAFGGQPADTMFVGSSLVATIAYDNLLPPSWYAMGLKGGGSLTGLWVVAHSSIQVPAVILIDVNTLLREPDTLIYKQTCGVPQRYFKQLHAFRENARPNIFFQLVMAKLANKILPNQQISSSPSSHQKAIIRERIVNNTKQDKLNIERGRLDQNLSILKGLVEDLRAAGAQKIMLIEFPYSQEPLSKENFQKITGSARASFPSLPYFKMADVSHIQLPDGSHMDIPSSKLFVQELTHWLAKQ